MLVGNLYCGVLEACQETLDVHRAREWTVAFARWCEGQPDLVPYRGPCLVHRVEVMRLGGDWEAALEEARRACDWLSLPTSPEGPADALYQLADLHRLRGELDAAEAAYREASRLGRRPDPGLALLLLARGDADAAAAAVQRALEEAGADRPNRSQLLAAYVEVFLAMHNPDQAQKAVNELADLAAGLDVLPMRALADQTAGAVLVAQNRARAALPVLRRCYDAWQQVGAPYEAARVRVLIATACRELGDADSAAMEMDAARWVFERLRAAPDLARLAGPAPHPTSHGLTAREVEVVKLITAGQSNRKIAASLVISEHTVARHIQNMLQKLGFSSRTGLVAFAVEQGLTKPPSSQN